MTGNRFDMIIVGAGIAGAAVAYFAAQNRRVLLVEAENHAGYHSTGRSAALFAETYGPPVIRALTRASRSFLDTPPTGFTDSPLLRRRGTLSVGMDDQRQAVAALLADMVREGSAPQLLDANDCVALVPVLRREASVAAVYDPTAADIDVAALLQGFLTGARKRGATVTTGARVVALEYATGQWTVRLESGVCFVARAVVNAAGAWADEIAHIAGVGAIGLQPLRRSAFLFNGPERLATAGWPAVMAIDDSWYFKPDAGLLLGSPANADPDRAHDVVAEEIDIATGIFNIEAATTLTVGRPRHTWAGLRCFVADGNPVLGFDRKAPGFFWAAALGGYGIQTAPAIGRLCACLLDHHVVAADFDEHLDLQQLLPGRTRETRTTRQGVEVC